MSEVAIVNSNDALESVGQFELTQRAAKLFSSSSMVPQQFQNSIANCFIAIDMARRLGMSPMQVMQNLYIVHGKPAWSSQFLIATFNCTGRYGAIRYSFQGKPGTDDYGCIATAIEKETGEVLQGPLVTIGIAKREGWYSKKDKKTGAETSKWQTMPQLMLRYRAAAWFIRSCAPEIAMGLYTVDEVKDIQQNGTISRQIETEYRPTKDQEVIFSTPEIVPQPIEDDPVDITYNCPKSEGRLVTDTDCRVCTDQQGCPEYGSANAA